MKAIRRRMPVRASDDSGLSLIEVLVAMMVFAIISIGIAYSLTSALAMTSDARSREVAANLAAQDIDLVRAVEDVFSVGEANKTFVVNGTTFRLHREASWIPSTGVDASCGSGGGQLRYKRVNVAVEWDGMRAAASAVRSDTIITPGSRINDPDLGSILVSVITAAGTGSAGVTVTAVPSSTANGAVAITETIKPTDAEGCTYILKVTPGNYDVTVSRAGYVDIKQAATSTSIVGVGKGTAASVAFQYDKAGLITASYASNAPAGTTLIPTTLDTTLRNTYGLFNFAATTSARSKTFNMHPFDSYEVFAGRYVAPTETSAGCVAADPSAWTTPAAADGAVGPAPSTVTSTGSVNVAMGVLTVLNLNGKYLRAVSQAYAPGDGAAGCGTSATGQMSYVIGPLSSNAAQIALPFGAWLLTSGNSTTQATAVPASSLAKVTRADIAGTGVVTLDPRVVPTP